MRVGDTVVGTKRFTPETETLLWRRNRLVPSLSSRIGKDVLDPKELTPNNYTSRGNPTVFRKVQT